MYKPCFAIPCSRRKGAQADCLSDTAASSPELLEEGWADLWDSGKCRKKEIMPFPMKARRLRPGKEVFWKARVWDEKGTFRRGADPPL